MANKNMKTPENRTRKALSTDGELSLKLSRESGFSWRELAEMYGIHKNTARNIYMRLIGESK